MQQVAPHAVLELSQGSYYRARYYDPQAGRFLSEDPIRFIGGIDFYKYVSNNAITRVDPSGLIHQSWPPESPGDGRLHNDPAGGLEVLCTKGRNKQHDIGMLQQSIAVRFIELVQEGDNADPRHVLRVILEVIALKRCQDSCENEEKPQPEPAPDNVNEENWWQHIMKFVEQNPWVFSPG
jgi:RHS repeat-associated protein